MGANELQAKVEIIDNNYKAALIDEIIFVCKTSNVSNDRHIPLDIVFINLIGLSIPQLKTIASELNIKDTE